MSAEAHSVWGRMSLHLRSFGNTTAFSARFNPMKKRRKHENQRVSSGLLTPQRPENVRRSQPLWLNQIKELGVGLKKGNTYTTLLCTTETNNTDAVPLSANVETAKQAYITYGKQSQQTSQSSAPQASLRVVVTPFGVRNSKTAKFARATFASLSCSASTAASLSSARRKAQKQKYAGKSSDATVTPLSETNTPMKQSSQRKVANSVTLSRTALLPSQTSKTKTLTVTQLPTTPLFPVLPSDQTKKAEVSQVPFSSRTLGSIGKNPLTTTTFLDPSNLTIAQIADRLGKPEQQSRIMTLARYLLPEDINVTWHTKLTVEEAEFLCEELNASEVLRNALNAETPIEPSFDSGTKVQPVVIVMGHVNHGKTTLLDKLRNSNVAAVEVGGITQTVSAYQVCLPPRQTGGEQTLFTFIDTPGHEAFRVMRTRGAQIADLALLVIAVDAGLQPQTREAHDIIRHARIPMIVVFTKIDKVPSTDTPRIIEQIQRELGLDQTTSLISVSARTGLHIDRLQSALLAFEWQNPALRSNAVAMRSTAYVLETHRQAQHGSTFYTCVFKGGPQLSVGSFVAVNKCCGKLVRLLPIGNALDTKDQCRDIRYGQPFVAVVDHGKHAFSARKQGLNAYGDYLIQLSSSRELRQLERYYAQIGLENIDSDSDVIVQNNSEALTATTTGTTATSPESTLIIGHNASNRQQDEVILELLESTLWEEEFHEMHKLDGAASAKSNVTLIEIQKRRLLYKQQCPKLPVYLVAQDDGGLYALRNWITEYNMEQELAFWGSTYPAWNKEQRLHPQWERASVYDEVPTLTPLHIFGTTTGTVALQTLNSLRKTGIPIFCFYPSTEAGQWTEAHTATTPIRCHGTIYNVVQEIQALSEYYFNPKMTRKEVCLGGPIQDTCVINLQGKRMVGEVKLTSGKFKAEQVSVDIWRPDSQDNEGPNCIPPSGKLAKMTLKGFKLLRWQQKLLSIRVNGRPATIDKSVSAPCVLQFTLANDIDLQRGDLVKWYNDVPTPAPPYETESKLFSKAKFITH